MYFFVEERFIQGIVYHDDIVMYYITIIDI